MVDTATLAYKSTEAIAIVVAVDFKYIHERRVSIIGLVVEHNRTLLKHNRASFWEMLKSIIE